MNDSKNGQTVENVFDAISVIKSLPLAADLMISALGS